MTGRRITEAVIDRNGCPAERHGRVVDYTHRKCRCADAREAHRLDAKRRREGRHVAACVDSTGTARRLQSLIVAGHSQRDLAVQMNAHPSRIRNLLRRDNPTVTLHTEAAVKDLFRRLDGVRGTSGGYAFACARRHGWVDAAAWDDIDDPTEQPKVGDPTARIIDEVAVARALAGDQVRLSRAEAAVAVEIGRGRGLSATEVGQRLQIAPRTVLRIGARVRAAA